MYPIKTGSDLITQQNIVEVTLGPNWTAFYILINGIKTLTRLVYQDEYRIITIDDGPFERIVDKNCSDIEALQTTALNKALILLTKEILSFIAPKNFKLLDELMTLINSKDIEALSNYINYLISQEDYTPIVVGINIVGIPASGKTELIKKLSEFNERIFSQPEEGVLDDPTKLVTNSIELPTQFELIDTNLNILESYIENSNLRYVQICKAMEKKFKSNSISLTTYFTGEKPSADDLAYEDFSNNIRARLNKAELNALIAEIGLVPINTGYFLKDLSSYIAALQIDIENTNPEILLLVKQIMLISKLLPYQPESSIFLDISIEEQSLRLEKLASESPIEVSRRTTGVSLSIYILKFYKWIQQEGLVTYTQSPLLSERYQLKDETIEEVVIILMEEKGSDFIFYLKKLHLSVQQYIFRSEYYRECLKYAIYFNIEVYQTKFKTMDLKTLYTKFLEVDKYMSVGSPIGLRLLVEIVGTNAENLAIYLNNRKKIIFELKTIIEFQQLL